jgi:hypothetical protein
MHAILGQRNAADHLSHEVISRPPKVPSQMKPTLQHMFGHKVTQFANDGVISALDYMEALKAIHSEVVTCHCVTRGPNRVLGIPPPAIDPSDKSLPRVPRHMLSQLRSDWCKNLKSYQKLIRKGNDDVCPEGQESSHVTAYLFSCPAVPTNLVPIDLWARPREAISFVSYPPSFSHLSSLDPPLLPPPPQTLLHPVGEAHKLPASRGQRGVPRWFLAVVPGGGVGSTTSNRYSGNKQQQKQHERSCHVMSHDVTLTPMTSDSLGR